MGRFAQEMKHENAQKLSFKTLLNSSPTRVIKVCRRNFALGTVRHKMYRSVRVLRKSKWNCCLRDLYKQLEIANNHGGVPMDNRGDRTLFAVLLHLGEEFAGPARLGSASRVLQNLLGCTRRGSYSAKGRVSAF